MTSRHRNKMALADYLEVCIESCYWCDYFAFKLLAALIFSIAINSLMD